ncbi:helix-turn-helix domain-containing protein [Frigidibacter oleivorans]|uniref:helix-turn-helix domain-containing protein n=1 Tax=Frigidibacter oleivorans TaxID=2487129 RepID=UPI000F8F3BF8|nr:helix-turn-helix transcriptional regulator [Frigidibacter oleivorans]
MMHDPDDNDLDDFLVGLKLVMERRGLKPAPLAIEAGLGVTAIRDLYRRRSSPKVSTAEAIARQLDMGIDEIIAAGARREMPSRPTTPVVGRIAEGGCVKGFGHQIGRIMEPQLLRGADIAALLVAADIGPLHPHGSIFVFEVAAAPVSAYPGRASVVVTGAGQVLLGAPRRGSKAGLWNITPLVSGVDAVWDERIRAVHPIRLTLFPDLAEMMQ